MFHAANIIFERPKIFEKPYLNPPKYIYIPIVCGDIWIWIWILYSYYPQYISCRIYWKNNNIFSKVESQKLYVIIIALDMPCWPFEPFIFDVAEIKCARPLFLSRLLYPISIIEMFFYISLLSVWGTINIYVWQDGCIG